MFHVERITEELDMQAFFGKGKTLKNPAVFTLTHTLHFGGHTIPAGTEVKQFETRNFGFTVYKDKYGKTRLARY